MSWNYNSKCNWRYDAELVNKYVVLFQLCETFISKESFYSGCISSTPVHLQVKKKHDGLMCTKIYEHEYLKQLLHNLPKVCADQSNAGCSNVRMCENVSCLTQFYFIFIFCQNVCILCIKVATGHPHVSLAWYFPWLAAGSWTLTAGPALWTLLMTWSPPPVNKETRALHVTGQGMLAGHYGQISSYVSVCHILILGWIYE